MVSKSYQKIYFTIWKCSQNFKCLSRVAMIPAILHTRRIFYCSIARIYMGMSPIQMLYAFPNRYLGPEREVGFADDRVAFLVVPLVTSWSLFCSYLHNGLLSHQSRRQASCYSALWTWPSLSGRHTMLCELLGAYILSNSGTLERNWRSCHTVFTRVKIAQNYYIYVVLYIPELAFIDLHIHHTTPQRPTVSRSCRKFG